MHALVAGLPTSTAGPLVLLPNLPGPLLCVRRPHGAIQEHSLLSSRKGPAARHGPRAPLTAAHNALVDLR
ncbi:hypothetical protein GCM10027612_09410 [Microbispora bryophytorum subsp. camponoti]